MRKSVIRIMGWLMLLVLLEVATASALSFDLYASSEFASTGIRLKATKAVQFYCTTYEAKENLSVTACWLEVKNKSGAWAYLCPLPAPTVVATGKRQYSAAMDYSAYISAGCYRIRGRFDADGHTISVVSNEQTF